MILLIAAPTLAIYVAILGVMAFYTYHEAKDARQRVIMQLAASYASRFDGQLREAAQIATTTADFVTTAGMVRAGCSTGGGATAGTCTAGGALRQSASSAGGLVARRAGSPA